MSTRVTFGDLGSFFSESQRPENIDLKKIFLMPNKCKFFIEDYVGNLTHRHTAAPC